MVIVKDGFHCNIPKIESYLKEYKINHDSIVITISDGGWTLDVFGNTDGKNKINVFLPSWIPNRTKELAISKIITHEWAHIKGIDACKGSFFQRISCLMYESNRWQKEILCLPIQLLSGLKLCSHCRKRLGNM